jgi:hypothetical protein
VFCEESSNAAWHTCCLLGQSHTWWLAQLHDLDFFFGVSPKKARLPKVYTHAGCEVPVLYLII